MLRSLFELVDCVKKSERALLSGEAIFSLTPSVVTQLSKYVIRIPSLITDRSSYSQASVIETRVHDMKLEELVENLQYLGFIAERAVAVKITNNDGTLQGTLSLQPFRSLRFLEVRKLPLHLVKGLTHLRGQLETVVCSRSIQSLDLLLLKCGGDASHAFNWPQLRTLIVTDSDLEELDNSLALVPVLQNLDLSRNSIRNCKDFFSYLEELTVVNLSNNRLEKPPKFSVFGRSRICVLSLRNNCLDSIEGLEDLENLKNLDLSENCIADHKLLWPLRHLPRLENLNLLENPIQFHRLHRSLTMKYVNPRTVKDHLLILDGAMVNATEAMSVPEGIIRPLPRSASVDDIIAISIESMDDHSSARNELTSSVRSSGGKRKLIKTRVIKLDDADQPHHGNVQQVFSIPADPLNDLLGTSSSSAFVQDMEDLREKFGEEWLKFHAAKDPLSDTSVVDAVRAEERIVPNFADEIGNLETEEILNRSDSLETSLPTQSGENESSPFLVQFQGETDLDESLLITVGDIHIIERNISGIIVEMLEIGSIQKAEVAGELAAKIVVYFDYVRKDRRKRTYYFEDSNQAAEFLQLIHPLIELKSDKALNYQCLQCSGTFPEYQAERKVKYLSKGEFPTGYSNSVGSASASLKGELTEAVLCPFCGSEMLVQHNIDARNEEQVNHVSPPVSRSIQHKKSPELKRSNSVVILSDEPSYLEETILPSSYRSPPPFFSSSMDRRNSVDTTGADFERHDSSEETLFMVQSVDEALDQLHKKAAVISVDCVKWNYCDYNDADHRLRLHIEMNLFTEPEEHFALLLKSGFLNLRATDSHEYVIIVSNLHLYVLRIDGSTSQDPALWLTPVDKMLLQEVDMIHQVCEGECLRIAFKDRTFWLILLRDRERCLCLTQQLEEVLTSNKVQFCVRETSDIVALEAWLAATPFDREDTEAAISLRTLCYMGKSPVTILCTESHVVITRDDYQQLLQGGNSAVTLVDVKPISAISCLVSYLKMPTDIGLKFFEEDPDFINQWDFRFETVDGLERLVHAIRDPWETLIFHVPLNFEVHP